MATVCAYCDDTHFTTSTLTSSRRVRTPDGLVVHFKCLGEWLIDDALDRAFGKQSRNARRALRARLRLDREPAVDLPPVKEVARAIGFSFPWVSQVQRNAMERFERQAERARREQERRDTEKDRSREERETREQLIADLRADVDALAKHLGVQVPPPGV